MPQLGYTKATIVTKKTPKAADESNAEETSANTDKSPDAENTAQSDQTSNTSVTTKKSSKGKAKATIPSTSATSSEAKQPEFGWSRSIQSGKHTVGEMRGYLHEATSIQSLLWTAYQAVLPFEVTEDFKETMECHGLPPMDWNMKGKPVDPTITVKSNGTTYNLSGFELGPPASVCGMNYAKVIHSEDDANEYVISFTTMRTTGPDEGRHFLFAKYEVKVPNTRNTVIVHRTKDAHGTTLPHRSPEEDKAMRKKD